MYLTEEEISEIFNNIHEITEQDYESVEEKYTDPIYAIENFLFDEEDKKFLIGLINE